MRPSLAPIGAVLLAALFACACSSSTAGQATGSAGGSAGDTSAAVVTAATSAPQTDGTSGSDVTSPPPTATVTVTATPAITGCTNAAITVTSTAPPAGGALGHEGLVLLFTNNGSSPCTLTGYPGAAGLNSSGAQVAQATRTLDGVIGGCHCTTPPLLTLNPGDAVSSVIEGNIGGPGPCTPFPALLVTPPNTTMSTHIAAGVPSCGFDIHPVVTGHSGGGPS